LDLPELVCLIQARLWRGFVDRSDTDHLRLLCAANRTHGEERGEVTNAVLTPELKTAAAPRRAVTPAAYCLGATSIAVIVIMAAPIVFSSLASIKTAADASAIPPHFLPRALSFENYAKVINFQAGLATYVANSALVAAMTIAACLALAAPA